MKLSIHSFTAILVATLFLPNNGSAQSKTEDTVFYFIKEIPHETDGTVPITNNQYRGNN